MSNMFTLSIGQAQQLEFAFARNDWMSHDVHKLCSGDTLKKVLAFLNDEDTQWAVKFLLTFREHGGTDREFQRLAGLLRHDSDKEWCRKMVDGLLSCIRNKSTFIALVSPADMELHFGRELATVRNLYTIQGIPIENILVKGLSAQYYIGHEQWVETDFEAATITNTVKVLHRDEIFTLPDLVQRNESELLRIPNFGRTMLNCVKEALSQRGLHLGMELPS